MTERSCKMKKLLCAFLVLTMICSLTCTVLAEEEIPKCQKLTVILELTETEHLTPQTVRFNLFNENGDFLYNAYADIIPGMEQVVLEFMVGPFDVGQKFLLCMTEGLESVKYYDQTYLPGQNINIDTYSMKLEDGSLFLGDTFHLNADPYTTPPVRINELTINLTLSQSSKLLNQTVRFNLFNEDGVFLYNAYATIKSGVKEVNVTFPVGPFDAGQKFQLCMTEGAKSVTYYTDEYKPGENIEIATYSYMTEEGIVKGSDTFHLALDPYTQEDAFRLRAVQFVNQKGYKSKTDYLIWISKSDYKVTLFKKEADGSWGYVNSFLCSIGAPGTPTVEGEFEYIQYQTAWYYKEGFWCGPIMRFYRGYALHSTLFWNNGSSYDSRLGMKISHGCIRLHPDHINYLVDVTPMYTAIVVTP